MESIPQLFTKLHEILPEIESNSYFDLSDQAKEVLSHFEGTNPDVPRIEAWSFVPHPNVLKAFTGRHRNLRRYIMTIDAMRSKIYIPIRDFLLKQTTNVTSYYTGGWADFICDVQMDPESFEGLLADIRAVLIDNG